MRATPLGARAVVVWAIEANTGGCSNTPKPSGETLETGATRYGDGKRRRF